MTTNYNEDNNNENNNNKDSNKEDNKNEDNKNAHKDNEDNNNWSMSRCTWETHMKCDQFASTSVHKTRD